MKRICLVTPGHLASTPRLVREADALAEEGYDVHVVYGWHFPPAGELDQAVLKKSRWQAHAVRLTGTLSSRLASVRGRLSRKSAATTWENAARRCHVHAPLLADKAASLQADAYHGHCLGGLAAAALAAKKNNVFFGFDIEDFHESETEGILQEPVVRNAAILLQKELLPRCRIVTSSSASIAERIHKDYGVPSKVLHNVYPVLEGPASFSPPPAVGPGQPLRVYWFSQTVGEGRGLEAAIKLLGGSGAPVELHLRGFVSDDYRNHLEKCAEAAGVFLRLIFLPPGDPDKMPLLSAGYHLGISFERRYPENRNLCLTNKIFAYLLAGIPVWLSDTDAQHEFSIQLGEASLLEESKAPNPQAGPLQAFLASPEKRLRCAEHAWELSHNRFCWDEEKKGFIRLWHEAFELSSP